MEHVVKIILSISIAYLSENRIVKSFFTKKLKLKYKSPVYGTVLCH